MRGAAKLVPSLFEPRHRLFGFDRRTLASYGAGSAGTSTYVPVLAGGGRRADVAGRLQIHDGLGQAFGVLGAGFGRVNVPVFGGALLVNPLSVQPIVLAGPALPLFAARGGGYLHLGFPIPNQPGLGGVTIDWQAAFLDAAAVGGVSLTNAVELVIQ